MFKKTLLALTIAGISGVAAAGTIYTSTTDGTIALFTNTPLAGEALGVNGALLGGDDNCAAAATDLGVTANLGGFTPTNGNTDGITIGVADGTTVASVTYTGIAACTVQLPQQTVTTATLHSIEAAQNVAVPANATLVAGIGGYDVGDTITINISGAQIDLATSVAPTLTDLTTGGGGIATIGVLDITASQVRFTITGANNVAGKGALDLTGINLDATGLSSNTEVQYSAFATNTSGTDFDVTSGVVVVNLVPQYSATVTDLLDGIVDVSADRQSLALNADDAHTGEIINQDTLALAVSLDATGTTITPATVAYVISGNFAWLDGAADTTADATAATPAELATYLGAGFYTGTGDDTFLSATLNADLDQLTVVTTAVSGDVDTTGEFLFPVQGAGAGNEVLAETTYSVSITASDATAAPNTITMSAGSDAAGAWTLNGSVVTVPYMPFDDNTAVIMRHTNTGVQAGDISVRYMLEGVSTNWESAGVVGTSSRGVMNIRDLVINAIKAAAGVTSGKVAIEITTNVPSADVTVYAGFKVKDEQDRGFVGTFGQHGSAQ
jgi:hypothetical protein